MSPHATPANQPPPRGTITPARTEKKMLVFRDLGLNIQLLFYFFSYPEQDNRRQQEQALLCSFKNE